MIPGKGAATFTELSWEGPATFTGFSGEKACHFILVFPGRGLPLFALQKRVAEL